MAWIIGWDLILEYGVSVAAVAVGWGGNLNEFLENTFGVALPAAISAPPSERRDIQPAAVIIVFAITWLLVIGVRESAQANFVMVIIKLAVLVFFIVAAYGDQRRQLHAVRTSRVRRGYSASAIIFFAYIGFDAVSTGSEEAKDPNKDLPLAIVPDRSLLRRSFTFLPSRCGRIAPR